MKVFVFTCFVILTCYASLAQIKPEDSTVHIISYWNKGDELQYKVTYETVKLKGQDTTAHERSVSYYNVKVTKETKKSYTMQWLCKGCEIKSESPILRRLSKGCKDMKIVYETDEMGEFKKLVNMKQIKKQMEKSYKDVKKELGSIEKMKMQIEQMEKIALTESAVEENALAPIELFHSLHGRQFKLKELLQGEIKESNQFGGEDFDTKFSLILDSINVPEDFSIVKLKQIVNEEQLRKETLNYLINLAKSMNAEEPTNDHVKDLKRFTDFTFVLFGDGWVREVSQTITVTNGDTSQFITTKIELE